MPHARQRHAFARKCGALALIAAMTGAFASAAQAGSLFDMLFGGLGRSVGTIERAIEPPVAALGSIGDSQPVPPPRGGGTAFCVRSCDGRYFPVQAQPGLSARNACSAMCPAAATRIFYGSQIDRATSENGVRYTDIPNAFAYRERIVPQCTCNGRTSYGLAAIDVKNDPTLRKGDIVATPNGLAAFAGATQNREARFTPVQNYRGLPSTERAALGAIEVTATRNEQKAARLPQRLLPPAATSTAATSTATMSAGMSARAEAPASSATPAADRNFNRRWVADSDFFDPNRPKVQSVR